MEKIRNEEKASLWNALWDLALQPEVTLGVLLLGLTAYGITLL